MIRSTSAFPETVLFIDNIMSSCSAHEDSRLLKTEQYNLYIDGARLIPLKDTGFRLSEVKDLEMGFIIHLPHSEGTMSLSNKY